MTSPRDNHEMIEAAQIGAEQGQEPMKITRAQLMMVIRQRVEELTSEIEAALKDLGLYRPGRSPGGADRGRRGAQEYRRLHAGRARPGGPRRPSQADSPALPDAHSGPAFSTLVGLALLAGSGQRRHPRHRDAPAMRKAGKGVIGRLIYAMKGGY